MAPLTDPANDPEAPAVWRRLNEWLRRWPPLAVLAAGVALDVAILAGDLALGAEVSLTPLYLAPVLFVAWYGPRGAGPFVAILSGLSWYAARRAGSTALLPVWIEYWDALLRIAVCVICALLGRGIRAAWDRERRFATTDYLTGLANARAFYDAAARELSRARRYGHAMAVGYLDLDGFKAVNDARGHAAGDELLRAVADTIRADLRASDVAARLGGDEFGVLLPQTDARSAQAVADKLHERVDAELARRGLAVTASIGMATAPAPLESAERLIREADRLLYEAKRTGKDRVLAGAVLPVEPAREP